MTIKKVLNTFFHIVLRIVLVPLVLALILASCLLGFAGGVIKILSGLVGVVFILGGIISVVMQPYNGKFFWECMLIGVIFGGVPVFICTLGSAFINKIVIALSRI